MHKYHIRNDVDGYYICTKNEARAQDAGTESSYMFRTRTHYKTHKEARAAVKVKISKCTK